jgi:hypothetical protein
MNFMTKQIAGISSRLPQRKPWLGFYGSRLLADYRAADFDYLLLLPGKKKAPKGAFRRACSLLLSRQYGDSLSLFVFPLVANHAVDQREKRKVPPHANVFARVYARANLAHQNVSRSHAFSTENLHTPSLSLAVAPVARAAARLFVCHWGFPLPTLRSR